MAIQHSPDSLCMALLRGEGPAWPFTDAGDMAGLFIEHATFHGVECLLHERLQQLPGAGWPAAVRSELQKLATARAVWELRNRQQMSVALRALAGSGIDVLIYKGTALAYGLYANPVWRPRGDSDLLIVPGQLQAAIDVLAGLGYRQYTDADEMIRYKLYFSQEAPEGGTHSIDLHWKLNNSELLSSLFSFDELRARALPVPELAPQARTVSLADAMVIACLHRGVHKLSGYTVNGHTRYTGDRLIWLQDIDLLARRLDPATMDTFVVLAGTKGLAGICRESLLLAAEWLHTPLPAGLIRALEAINPGKPDSYLCSGPFRRAWLDLHACSGLPAKAAHCRYILFPPAAYMRGKYGKDGRQWLPWLYLCRIASGLFQRIRLGMVSS